MSYFKKALVLCGICAICACLIAAVYLITNPIIERNKIARENEALSEIYNDATFEKIDTDNSDINNVWYAYKNDELVGMVFSVSGKNSYGTVTVLFGVDNDGSISKVILTENSESYAPKLEEHVENSYNHKVSDLESVDTACGATFGAELVKELINKGLLYWRQTR